VKLSGLAFLHKAAGNSNVADVRNGEFAYVSAAENCEIPGLSRRVQSSADRVAGHIVLQADIAAACE